MIRKITMWRFLVTQPCLVYEGSPLLFFYAHTCRLWWVTCRLLAVRVVPRIIPRICCPWIRGWLVLFVHGCGGKSCKHQHKTLRALDTALLCTLCGVRSVVIFGELFLKCSTSCWADTAATVQPYWWPEHQKENKTKHLDRADATQCRKRAFLHGLKAGTVLRKWVIYYWWTEACLN